ncbi:MAG: hypothetical protein CMJ81_11625 [Planctomycetaceae bacterium]|nr:hypothetical protein [Planctomycetaceae bacterium]MBP63999.1 hypothetical protein [Planctomycetaceae bacterium]
MLNLTSNLSTSDVMKSLDEDGFAVITNVISPEDAAEFAELTLRCPTRSPGARGWEAYVTLLNFDLRFASLTACSPVLKIVRQLLGGRTEAQANAFAWPVEDQIRLSNMDGLVAHPGSDPGVWHNDPPMGQLNPDRPLPKFPTTVNVMWLLTPFSRETGATRVLPGSHRFQRIPDPTTEDLDGQVTLTTPAGSLAIVPNTCWHAAGANQSSQQRVAVNCNYAPWWLGRITPDIYPVRPEVYQALPPQVQALTKHQLNWNTDFRGQLTEK